MMSLFRKPATSAPILAHIQANQSRKDAAALRMRYYADQHREDTLRLIRQRFSDADQFRIFTHNIVRLITNKLAGTYRTQPVRKFSGMDQAKGEQLYRDIGADRILKRASRMVKLHKTCALQVRWDEARERPAFALITPNILDAVASDPEWPERLIVTATGARPELTEFSDWTAETFTRRDHRAAPISAKPNPYGALPFVPLFDYAPDDVFFLPGGSDLIEAQDAINVALANLWRAVELQAHGQAWAVGVPANQILRTGPATAITLPEGGSFGYATPSAPIGAILSAIEFVMRQTAAVHGIGAEVFNLAKRAESGAAKEAERTDLKEARADDQQLWRDYEARLFHVLKLVANTHRAGFIPEAATVSVDFREPEESLSEAERLTSLERKSKLGIFSPVDCLMTLNPDGFATRELALAELIRRKSESAQIAQSAASAKDHP